MIGDLQRQKASYYFDLIDEDDNGFIELRDFKLRAKRMADARNVTDEEAIVQLQDRVMTWWEHLCAIADFDDDDRVTREEWETYWESIDAGVNQEGEESEKTLDTLVQAARGTFKAINTGSGPITEEEYADWLEAWGVEDSAAAFQRLDRDDSGTLTEENLVEAVKEFYLSNDPEAPGNALYGELPE
jgi:Ca2+-binding EF-hand superfamily protein